jgi:hypothetical protein
MKHSRGLRKLSPEKLAALEGGVMPVDWRAICSGLLAVVGMAQFSGDKAMASAAWGAWTNAGCAQY